VQTRRLIDSTALKQMRASAVLVDIAAGGIVDEAALADAHLTPSNPSHGRQALSWMSRQACMIEGGA
jgi:alanine dehydrogenase